MASKPGVALRLGMEGKEEVKSGFDEIGAAGDRAAKRAAAAFDRASADIAEATKRQTDAAAKLAAVGVRSSMGPNANQQVLDYRAFTTEMALQGRQAEALRDALEPLRVAERAYGDEIDRLRKLQASGKISGEEYAAGLRLANSGLAEAKRNLGEHSAAMGLNRTQTMIAQSAGLRFTDMLIAGQSPLRAFALEAHKLAEVAAFDDDGVAGALTKVRALLTPVTVGIAAATAVLLAGTAAWSGYAGAAAKFNALAGGAGAVQGLDGAQLEANAEAAAKASAITVASAREIETAYVQTGKIGGDVLGGLTAVTKDFAAGTGTSVDQAKDALARAFADPAKGADELNGKYGILSAATAEYIHQLVEEGREHEAQQVLLKAVQDGFSGAAAKAKLFGDVFGYIKAQASDALNSVGRLIDRVVTGGSAAERLTSLMAQRSRAKSDSYGLADTSDLDKQIADLQGQLRTEQQRTNNALARSRAGEGMKAVDAFSGDDKLGELRSKLTAVNAVLAPGAGASADQLKNAREAQDAYTRAIQSYLPPAEKKRQMDVLDAQIAAAKTPAQKAALAAQRAQVDLSGQVVTKAQAEADAHAKGAQALATASKAGEGHAKTLARDAAAMEVSAQQANAVAEAYLKSSAAGDTAAARRKAMTDATKQGGDVDAQVRRQMELAASETAATGGKTVAGLRDENTARATLMGQVSAGVLGYAQLSQALADEAQRRVLTIAMDHASIETKKELVRVIAGLKDAQSAANDNAAHLSYLGDADSIDQQTAKAKIAAAHAGDPIAIRDRAIAEAEAASEAKRQKLNAADTASLISKRGDAVVTDQVAAAARYYADTRRSQQDSLEYSRVDLSLIGANTEKRDLILNRLREEQRIREQFPAMAEADVQATLDGVDAQTKLNAVMARTANDIGELRTVGGQFVDDVLNPSNWSSWSNLGKTAIKDIETELLKLALINPLKNLINGNNAATTLGGAFSALTKLFGGAIGGTSLSPISNVTSIAPAFNIASLPKFASGTEYASGGAAWVGENGKELVNLPRGSSVMSAPRVSQMQAANDPARVHVTVGLDDDMLTAKVVSVSDGRIAAAAPGIAYGGAQIARSRAARSARVRIPGR